MPHRELNIIFLLQTHYVLRTPKLQKELANRGMSHVILTASVFFLSLPPCTAREHCLSGLR